MADGSGARSPMATVYSGVIVLLLAVFLGYFVGFIPRAALAVVVMGIDGGGLDDLLGAAVIGRDESNGTWLVWTHAWAQPEVLERAGS